MRVAVFAISTATLTILATGVSRIRCFLFQCRDAHFCLMIPNSHSIDTRVLLIMTLKLFSVLLSYVFRNVLHNMSFTPYVGSPHIRTPNL
jgi:hypothetical protein